MNVTSWFLILYVTHHQLVCLFGMVVFVFVVYGWNVVRFFLTNNYEGMKDDSLFLDANCLMFVHRSSWIINSICFVHHRSWNNNRINYQHIESQSWIMGFENTGCVFLGNIYTSPRLCVCLCGIKERWACLKKPDAIF